MRVSTSAPPVGHHTRRLDSGHALHTDNIGTRRVLTHSLSPLPIVSQHPSTLSALETRRLRAHSQPPLSIVSQHPPSHPNTLRRSDVRDSKLPISCAREHVAFTGTPRAIVTHAHHHQTRHCHLPHCRLSPHSHSSTRAHSLTHALVRRHCFPHLAPIRPRHCYHSHADPWVIRNGHGHGYWLHRFSSTVHTDNSWIDVRTGTELLITHSRPFASAHRRNTSNRHGARATATASHPNRQRFGCYCCNDIIAPADVRVFLLYISFLIHACDCDPLGTYARPNRGSLRPPSNCSCRSCNMRMGELCSTVSLHVHHSPSDSIHTMVVRAPRRRYQTQSPSDTNDTSVTSVLSLAPLPTPGLPNGCCW